MVPLFDSFWTITSVYPFLWNLGSLRDYTVTLKSIISDCWWHIHHFPFYLIIKEYMASKLTHSWKCYNAFICQVLKDTWTFNLQLAIRIPQLLCIYCHLDDQTLEININVNSSNINKIMKMWRMKMLFPKMYLFYILLHYANTYCTYLLY